MTSDVSPGRGVQGVQGTDDALKPLTPFGWGWGLVAILGGLALTYPVFGYPVDYWRNADMDLVVVYNAFQLNDGRPQEYFDHPGYVTILLTALWFKTLHALGLLQAWSASTMPPASDAAAFAAAMTQAVRAARALMMLIGLGVIAGFAFLLRRIVPDWRVALVATLALALSGGIAIHLDRMRTELLAAMPVIFALLILIDAARRATPLRPLWLAVAGLLCVLGLASKVHAVLLIAAFPVLLLPFGTREGPGAPPWPTWRGALVPLAVLAAATALAAFAAAPVVMAGLDVATIRATGIRAFHDLPPGLISGAILLWLAAGMIVFARVWRIGGPETVAALLCAAFGALTGLLTLQIVWHPFNAAAVLNPVERMLSYAIPFDATADIGRLGASLLSDIGTMLAKLTFVLHTSFRPAVFLVWVVVPGIVYAWIRGERQTALQAAVLIAVTLAIDTLGARRGLKAEYWIFTDPLVILAGALLLDRLVALRRARHAFIIAVALVAAHVVVSQSARARGLVARSGPESTCQWIGAYLTQMKLPFCP